MAQRPKPRPKSTAPTTSLRPRYRPEPIAPEPAAKEAARKPLRPQKRRYEINTIIFRDLESGEETTQKAIEFFNKNGRLDFTLPYSHMKKFWGGIPKKYSSERAEEFLKENPTITPKNFIEWLTAVAANEGGLITKKKSKFTDYRKTGLFR